MKSPIQYRFWGAKSHATLEFGPHSFIQGTSSPDSWRIVGPELQLPYLLVCVPWDDPIPWRADASWTFVHKRFENSQSGAAPEKEKQRHIYSAVRTTKFLNKFQEYASPGTILVTNNINLSCFPKTQGKNVRLATRQK